MKAKIGNFVAFGLFLFIISMIFIIPNVHIYTLNELVSKEDSLSSVIFNLEKQLDDSEKVNSKLKNILSKENISRDSTLNTNITYWYVLYETKNLEGFTIIKLNTPYPSISEIQKTIYKNLKLNGNEYLSLKFILKVPEITYLEYYGKI